MKALVTGGTGFVGGHLIRALLDAGVEVTALVRSAARGKELARRGVRLVEGDLGDTALLARTASDPDVVFHVAGLVAARSEAEFLTVNRDGTANLVGALAQRGGGRLVLVSSLAAGGPAPVDRPLTGTEPPQPVTAYGRSKAAGEAVVRASSLDWTIVRPPAVYGPGDREMFRLFRAAALGVGPVLGAGRMRLSLVYGPDLARALVAAAASPATVGGTYYAAHPEVLTSREVLRQIGAASGKTVRIIPIPRPLGRLALHLTGAAARLTGRATVLTPDKANEFFQEAWTCDPAPLTRATGWTAEHSLATGAERTVAWYRERGWL